MDYLTIDDIYDANDQFRRKFEQVIGGIEAGELSARLDADKWSIEQIIEHVCTVEEGMFKICRKLLGQAEEAGLKSSGEVIISDSFRAYTENLDGVKLEAPERVWPTGSLDLDGSRAKMAENVSMFESLRTKFREFDGTTDKFPHPHFGPLSAQDWLVLSGEHMHRHTGQIERIIEKIRH